jgi:hypothetical protein
MSSYVKGTSKLCRGNDLIYRSHEKVISFPFHETISLVPKSKSAKYLSLYCNLYIPNLTNILKVLTDVNGHSFETKYINEAARRTN